MARTTHEFMVAIEANMEGLRRGMKQAEKAVEDSNGKIRNSLNSIKRSFRGLNRTVGRAGGALVAFYAIKGAAHAIAAPLLMADRYGMLQDRLKAATRATGDYQKVSESLLNTSLLTGTALNANVDLFQRLAPAAVALGKSNDDILKLTEIIGKLGVISGATSDQMKNATLQFSQAMGEGVMRAQEFNSILDNAPAILQAIADGMGKSVSELRKMMRAGKLISKEVFEALLSQMKKVGKAYDEVPTRLEKSWTSFLTATSARLDKINEKIKITAGLAWTVEAAMGFIRPATTAELQEEKIAGINKRIENKSHAYRYRNNQIKRLIKHIKRLKEVERTEGSTVKSKARIKSEEAFLEKLKRLNSRALKSIENEKSKILDIHSKKTGIDQKAKEKKLAAEKEKALVDSLAKIKKHAGKVKEMMLSLDFDLAQSVNNQSLVIEMQKQKEVAVWKKMLDEKLISEQQFMEARKLINQKTSIEIKEISSEKSNELKALLADLNLDVAQSANNQLLVIEMQKQKEVAVWKKMLDEKAISEQQFAQARELINQKASNKIKNISKEEAKKLKESANEIGLAMAMSFESRGMDALLDGKYSDALKGIVRDLAEMTLRLLVLKPLTEKLFGNLEGGGSGGGVLGDILSKIGFVAGAKTGVTGIVTTPSSRMAGGGGGLRDIVGRAGGGPVHAQSPYMVGERGRELFVPRTSGVIIPTRELMGGGARSSTSIIINIDATGANDPAAVEEAANRAVARAVPQIIAATEARAVSRNRPSFV